MINFWCRIGIHQYRNKEEWTPSIRAMIVTRFLGYSECRKCGKAKDVWDFRFDPDTGESLDWSVAK